MHGLLTDGQLGLAKALDQLIVLFRAALNSIRTSTCFNEVSGLSM